jgi:hypothetical protein
MRAVLLCDRHHWTLDEYRRQPQWFITSLLSLMQNETEAANNRNKAG